MASSGLRCTKRCTIPFRGNGRRPASPTRGAMAVRDRPIEVLPTSVARKALSKTSQEFSKRGAEAEPVFFGAHRKPTGVMLSYERYLWLLDRVDDLAIALEIRQRDASDTGSASPSTTSSKTTASIAHRSKRRSSSRTLVMPRKARPISEPSKDGQEKQDERFSQADFDQALKKVTRRLDRRASEPDPESPLTFSYGREAAWLLARSTPSLGGAGSCERLR